MPRTRPLFLALLGVVAPAAARAEVVVGDGVPFTRAELEDAISARSDGGVTTGDVEVEAAGPAALQVRTRDGSWEVEVGDARGAAAARLVALHVVDRDGGGDVPAAPPPRVASAPMQTPPGANVDEVPDRIAAAGAPRPTTTWITFRTGATRGPSETDLTSLLGTIELSAARGRWIAAAEGGVMTSGSNQDAGDVRWVMPHARLGAGVRSGAAEVLAGPMLGRLYLANVPARRAATMVGLGGAARVRLPVGRGPWALTAGVGADVYRHRIVVRAGGVDEASTARVAFSMTLGVSMVLGR